MANTVAAAVPTYPELTGRVAVVTGGSKGIGAAACAVLCANGVQVAVVARDQDGIDGVVMGLRDVGGTAIGISSDVVSFASIGEMRTRVEEELGPVDILMSFAGGFSKMTPVVDITEEEWNFVIESNLTSTFLTCKAFLPGMIERGRGTIVTMASNAARNLDVTLTASYAASKAGIVMFTRHVAKEVGPNGVRVNCIAPATTISERVERIMTPERIQYMADLAPLGRIGMPHDSALAALFLVSDSASWLTGVTLDVAGGRIML